MKNFLTLLTAVVILAVSCVPEDESFHATSFESAASVTVPANVAFIKDVSTGVELPIGLLGKSEASAIQSVKLLVDFVPNGETVDLEVDGQQALEVTTYPSTVTITEAQLLDIAELQSVDELSPGDQWIIKYRVQLSDGRMLTHRVRTAVAFTCTSDLGGEIDYVTTNITAGSGGNAGACGASISGTVTFDDEGGGVYAISDATFGQYDCAWDDAPATGVSLVDICGSLSLIGADQYDLVYSISIVSNDGTTLVIDWENDFGDSGRTSLTRKDGSEWPLGLTTD
jgi:hypothetical protein